MLNFANYKTVNYHFQRFLMNLANYATIEAKIKKVIEEISDQPIDDNVTNDCDLLISGYLDSFGFVQLILNLEKTFEIKIDEETQMDPRLRNISGIVEIVSNL